MDQTNKDSNYKELQVKTGKKPLRQQSEEYQTPQFPGQNLEELISRNFNNLQIDTKACKQNLQGNVLTGRWSKNEHKAFIQGLLEYGKNWKKMEDCIPTRNHIQIRSHAQKFFHKIEKLHTKKKKLAQANIQKEVKSEMEEEQEEEEKINNPRNRSSSVHSVLTQFSIDNLSDNSQESESLPQQNHDETPSYQTPQFSGKDIFEEKPKTVSNQNPNDIIHQYYNQKIIELEKELETLEKLQIVEPQRQLIAMPLQKKIQLNKEVIQFFQAYEECKPKPNQTFFYNQNHFQQQLFNQQQIFNPLNLLNQASLNTSIFSYIFKQLSKYQIKKYGTAVDVPDKDSELQFPKLYELLNFENQLTQQNQIKQENTPQKKRAASFVMYQNKTNDSEGNQLKQRKSLNEELDILQKFVKKE